MPIKFENLKVDADSYLTLVTFQDAEEIFALVDSSRNYLREWLPWVDTNKTSADTREWIEFTQQEYSDRHGLHCCVRYKTKIMGIAAFHCLDWINQTAELAYWLAEQYQGHGLMTKSCRVLTNYAFKDFNLNRVEIKANNLKSCAVPERLGFCREGILRDAEWVNDRFVDNVVYSMLQRDWHQAQQLTTV